jgi:hypothetical protein
MPWSSGELLSSLAAGQLASCQTAPAGPVFASPFVLNLDASLHS